MKNAYTKNRSWLFLLTICFLSVLCLLLVTGAARAHYEASLEPVEQNLQYQSNAGRLYLLSTDKDELGKWESLTDDDGVAIPNTYVLDFLLCNGTSKENCSVSDQNASLVLFATVGIEDPEDVEITLSDGQSDYSAEASEVIDGSVWDNTYGSGWIYRFYNDAGEELSWSLSGGVFIYRQMRLTVKGTSESTAMLSLIATSRPGAI